MNNACRILVCRTCPRYEPVAPDGEETRGKHLGAAVRAAASAANGLENVDVRLVNCLAGCKRPCNVALDGPGRLRLRFSELTDAHIAALLSAAAAYRECADGDLDDKSLPLALRARVSARSPVRIGD